MATWAIGDFAMKSAGFTGFNLAGATGLVGSAAIGMALAYPVIKSVQNTMERQKYMHNIAADVEMYRDRLGFNGGLSMNQATALGGTLGGEMFKGGFFNKEQQMQIHKIAVSNDLISARGQGNESGTIQQYTKNFKELIKTTEMIVKTLQTTKEGALATMSDLNKRSGFSTMAQIQSQVIQAKALGNMSGIGSQNALLLGVAGANATQGTPWATSTGAGMYQYGAFNAGMLARGGQGAYAVERAGGVAQAGATLANIQMNSLMNGPIAMRFAAYAMNNNGSLNKDRMNALLQGKVSPDEIVSGSGDRGVGMGVSGRVMFNRNKAKLFNQMSPELLDRASRMEFELWSRNRGDASLEAKAWKFAEMKGMDYNSTELLYQSLTSSPGYNRIDMEKQAARAAAAPSTYYKTSGFRSALSNAWNKTFDPFTTGVASGVVDVQRATRNMGDFVNKAVGWTAREMGNAISRDMAYSLGIGSGTGFYEPKLGDRAHSRSIQYATGISYQEQENFNKLSKSQLSKIMVSGPKVGANSVLTNALNNMSAEQVKFVMDAATVASNEGTTDSLLQSKRFKESFGLTEIIGNRGATGKYRNQGIVDMFNNNSIGATNELKASYLALQQSSNSKADEEIKNWNSKRYSNKTSVKEQEIMDETMAQAKIIKGLIAAKDPTAYEKLEEMRKNKTFSSAWETLTAMSVSEKFSAESGVVSRYDTKGNKDRIDTLGYAITNKGKKDAIARAAREGRYETMTSIASPMQGYIAKMGGDINTDAGRLLYAQLAADENNNSPEFLKALSSQGYGGTEGRIKARRLGLAYLDAIKQKGYIDTGKKNESIAAYYMKTAGVNEVAQNFIALPGGKWGDLRPEDQKALIANAGIGAIVSGLNTKSAEGSVAIRNALIAHASSKTEDGSDAKKEFRKRGDKETFEAYDNAKNIWEMNMNIKKMTEREGAQGRSVEQVNTPPILNYWNNKW
jgi:hypothetical protein